MNIKYLTNYLKAGMVVYFDIEDAECLAKMRFRLKQDIIKTKEIWGQYERQMELLK